MSRTTTIAAYADDVQTLKQWQRHYGCKNMQDFIRAWICYVKKFKQGLEDRDFFEITPALIEKKKQKPIHPAMAKAHRLINKLVKKGQIKKPNKCSACSSLNKKLIAHHYVGYIGEDALKIILVCQNCHIQMHSVCGYKLGIKNV